MVRGKSTTYCCCCLISFAVFFGLDSIPAFMWFSPHISIHSPAAFELKDWDIGKRRESWPLVDQSRNNSSSSSRSANQRDQLLIYFRGSFLVVVVIVVVQLQYKALPPRLLLLVVTMLLILLLLHLFSWCKVGWNEIRSESYLLLAELAAHPIYFYFWCR